MYQQKQCNNRCTKRQVYRVHQNSRGLMPIVCTKQYIDHILSVPKCNWCTKRNDCNKRTVNDKAVCPRQGHGLGWFIHGLGLVGFSCQKLIIFFHYHNYPLRKSLTVIYHYSLHHEFFPQLPLGVAFYLLIGF